MVGDGVAREARDPGASKTSSAPVLNLPAPRLDGEVSLERVLHARHSVREYRDAGLTLVEVAQLLWAAQGITRRDGGRTAPSAGALYPLELRLVAGRVQGLEPDVYHYLPDGHRLAGSGTGEARAALAEAALGQEWVKDAPAVLVISAVEQRTTRKYGSRGHEYVRLEAGHAAQSALLQAAALGLGAVMVGAFDDAAVRRALRLPAEETPLYLMPLGRP
jgi:SagB-type dehydrogenase family enzyme